VAGKGIARLFTKGSEGYLIRYVREDPRVGTDSPDAFEQEALGLFSAQGQTELYRITTLPEGGTAFRYASALPIERNCLVCHGDPKGSFDEVGFLKEGMRLGDIGGAISITIPLEGYEEEAAEAVFRGVVFFLAMAGGISLIIRFALNRWVTGPLSRSNLRLMAENEEKSNFLTIMSHELRTPLTSIIAATDYWEKTSRKARGDASNEGRLVDEIRQNSRSLLDMVNNTIDVARLEAGRFETSCSELDACDLVNSIVGSLECLSRKHGVTLKKRIGADIPILLADAEAIRKIVMNLLSNALKFTEAGGVVTITVDYCAQEEALTITVSDTGIGIPPEDLEAVFMRFEQGSLARAHGGAGSGLGLFLVKSLTEKLGGTIQATSTVGVGSTFVANIPVPPAPAESMDEDDGEWAPQSPGRGMI
jgi:signal transduction histidine kinase